LNEKNKEILAGSNRQDVLSVHRAKRLWSVTKPGNYHLPWY
jgi:hypothetical protein